MVSPRKKRERAKDESKSQGNQCKKLPKQSVTGLLDLPSDIIIEILTRISHTDIRNCRCVCKTLHDLISDPSLVERFISRTPFLSILLSPEFNDCRFFKLTAHGYSNIYSSNLVNTSFIPNPSSFCLQIIGCSNGLICFQNYFSLDNNCFYITNPLLGDFVEVPNPRSNKYAAVEETYGFFSCPNPWRYKIMKIKTRWTSCWHIHKKTEVWILGVENDKWRYVGDAPFPLHGRFCHLIPDGHVYWIADYDHKVKGPVKLHSLDITKEQAHPVPVPAPPVSSCKNQGQELGVLGKCLCFFDSSRFGYLEIWAMREYRVATLWTKVLIVEIPFRPPILRSLAVQTNGLILMSGPQGSLYRYDHGAKNPLENRDFFYGDDKTEVLLYTPSFISLKHIFSGTLLAVRKVGSHA